MIFYKPKYRRSIHSVSISRPTHTFPAMQNIKTFREKTTKVIHKVINIDAFFKICQCRPTLKMHCFSL